MNPLIIIVEDEDSHYNLILEYLRQRSPELFNFAPLKLDHESDISQSNWQNANIVRCTSGKVAIDFFENHLPQTTSSQVVVFMDYNLIKDIPMSEQMHGDQVTAALLRKLEAMPTRFDLSILFDSSELVLNKKMQQQVDLWLATHPSANPINISSCTKYQFGYPRFVTKLVDSIMPFAKLEEQELQAATQNAEEQRRNTILAQQSYDKELDVITTSRSTTPAIPTSPRRYGDSIASIQRIGELKLTPLSGRATPATPYTPYTPISPELQTNDSAPPTPDCSGLKARREVFSS